MNMEIRKVEGQPLTTADRQQAISDSLRQIARVSRFADRKKGIRSFQDQNKTDPWRSALFALCFVLPTLAGAIYYGLIASDRYVTEASFAIRPAIGFGVQATTDNKSGSGGTGGAMGQMLNQDRHIVEEYVLSRPMVEAVETQLPIREWFSRDSIDWFSRFDPEKPIEKFLRYWRKRIDVSIEPDSNIITLTVEAFDPNESFAMTQAVMREAERMVNALSTTMREDAVAESTRELRFAEDKMLKTRLQARDLRNRAGVLDAQKANEANLKLITGMREARVNLAVQLAIGQRDLGPEARRIIDIKQQIKDLDENVARIERSSASQDPGQKQLLSDALTQFEALDDERKNMEKVYKAKLEAYEMARVVSARQIEFFSPIVQPVKAESSTQPRRLLMTSLIGAGAALLFAAIDFARKLMA